MRSTETRALEEESAAMLRVTDGLEERVELVKAPSFQGGTPLLVSDRDEVLLKKACLKGSGIIMRLNT